jgi:hypothetical protein
MQQQKNPPLLNKLPYSDDDLEDDDLHFKGYCYYTISGGSPVAVENSPVCPNHYFVIILSLFICIFFN